MYTLYPAITSQASTTSIASCVIFCLAPGPSPTIYNSFLLSAFMLLSVVALLPCFLCFSGIVLLFTFLFQLPVLGFFVCFSIPTPTTWVFLLAFHSLHPDCSSLS